MKMPSCGLKNNMNYTFVFMYISLIILFFIIGILYEVGKIKKNKIEEESVWWHGFILAIVAFIMLLVIHTLAKIYKRTEYVHNNIYFWSISHFILYMCLAIISPGQWSFWIALGILWEFIECYTICWKRIGIPMGCNGYPDIMTNLAGVAVGMWIKYDTQNLK
jgi:hypothetical protein